ncbi:unnamed protein product [Tilletia controversa]|uniref:Uncharacterized protein n=3 Tax=Tilletia TaxID=13289 RepID=A0A8X7SV18_9BASI|nr:hypothetical protein CF336_g5871 [Tilletia laevis]KAE8196603.1 hypothetical protein CF328_g4092 [Tilletia controversa]KAE8256666.1 hypothetical protein A4X03_0g5177 [Tilletia caries]KAE8201965.1 hypothetical protein CF335_g3595 [Tilletia laevis]KAE8243603.1 hypothetical protein A4X06_0g6203 [Tilletia controversa]
MFVSAASLLALAILGLDAVSALNVDRSSCEQGNNHCVFVTKTSADDFHFRNATFRSFTKESDGTYVFLYEETEGDDIKDVLYYKNSVIYYSFKQNFNILAPSRRDGSVKVHWTKTPGKARVGYPVGSAKKNDALIFTLL